MSCCVQCAHGVLVRSRGSEYGRSECSATGEHVGCSLWYGEELVNSAQFRSHTAPVVPTDRTEPLTGSE